MKKISNISWFSIIEVLVGIFIFTLWLISIYLIMVSSLKLNDYNKNQIIASNLAREQIELVRNIRDSNYKTLHAWNWIPNPTDNINPKFLTWSYYKVQNDFSWWTYPVDVEILWDDPVNPDIPEGELELPPSWWMDNYRLCLDGNNNYTFDCAWNETTPFYKYVKIEDIWMSGAFRLISKVIWYKRGYHEVEIKTIVTDWKRL